MAGSVLTWIRGHCASRGWEVLRGADLNGRQTPEARWEHFEQFERFALLRPGRPGRAVGERRRALPTSPRVRECSPGPPYDAAGPGCPLRVPCVSTGSWSERLNGGHRTVAVAPVLTSPQVERGFALGAAVGRVGLEPTADGL